MGTYRRGILFLLLVSILLGGTAVNTAVAQGEDTAREESGEAPPIDGLPAVLLFVVGAVVLVVSAENFIGYLVRTANGFEISLFLLAVVFTGIEFDDAVLGVATNLEDLGGVALGTALGTALSLTGVTLAATAIVRPFEVDVPDDYLWLFALSPLSLVPFVLWGTVSVLHGVLLSGLFLVLLVYFVYRESERGSAVFRDDDVNAAINGGDDRSAALDVPFVPERELPGITWLGLSLIALVGLVAGAESMAIATEGILVDYGLDGTVFGATIVTAVLTFEDLFLTLEPVRRGVPEIGIGNVIGSVVFSATGNVGVIALVGSITVGHDVLTWHLPVLVVTTALAAYFIGTNRLQRWHGVVLFGLYVAYWIVSFAVFSSVPVEA